LAATKPTGDRFTIITGGPGTGKTSLIAELRRRGFAGTVEAGRAIILDQTLIGGRALRRRRRTVRRADAGLGDAVKCTGMAEQEPSPRPFDRGTRSSPAITGCSACRCLRT
jgi:predicted ATPase